MNVLVIEGSRLAQSNTASIVSFLKSQIESMGSTVEVSRVPRWGAPLQEFDGILDKVRNCEAVVLAAPLYLDNLPAVTQRMCEEFYARRTTLEGVRPRFYGIAHSGFPESVQRQAELRSMQLFGEAVGWSWQGGAGFGGTSPIAGRPLEEAGVFARRLRQGLPMVARDIVAGRPLSARTAKRCSRSPLPAPRRLINRLINAGTRKAAKAAGVDIGARPYAR